MNSIEFDRGALSVPEVGFFGAGSASPNGCWIVGWVNNDGVAVVVQDGKLKGRIDCTWPIKARVSDEGVTLIVEGYLDELVSVLRVMDSKSAEMASVRIGALIMAVELSPNGRLILAATAFSDHEDSSSLFLIQCADGRVLDRLEVGGVILEEQLKPLASRIFEARRIVMDP
jgi:hypothetical protein